MKCTIPEMSWHNRDPVLSIDIQPKSQMNADQNKFTRLASGGTDTHVIIWYIMNSENGTMQLELAADLTRHQRAVNAVRWSPCGEYLASGDDDSFIYIWRLKSETEPINICDDDKEQEKETWIIFKMLRGHLDDVYDLSWSPNSLYLLSGSVDNTAIVWDIKKGKLKSILSEHKGFVQGVAWDPKDQYLVTLATDRYLRIFDANTLKTCRRLNKSTLPVDESSPLYKKQVRLFHDDTLQTFYRRLNFTPDGEMIIVPSGVCDVITPPGASNAVVDKSENGKPMHATYIFSRHSTKRPAIVIPSSDQYTVAVRCCPLLFELLPIAGKAAIDLPYRMIFAIATKNSVRLYDTQQQMPFAVISNIHYARLTDLTWSSDGTALIVSSFDGYCTLIMFDNGELGKIYQKPADEPMEISTAENGIKENIANSENVKEAPRNESTHATRIETRKQPRDFNKLVNDSESTQSVPVALTIPETIIATNELFESPEYKGTPATPIAIRREPRTNPSTPTGQNAKVVAETNDGVATKKATPIAVRRQPRNILAAPATTVNRTSVDQEEALDAWPIPIEAKKTTVKTESVKKFEPAAADAEKTEDMRLIYDGDSESIVMKTTNKPNALEANNVPSGGDGNESSVTHDTNNPKTPRRVQLRTISTPKSKKKLL